MLVVYNVQDLFQATADLSHFSAGQVSENLINKKATCQGLVANAGVPLSLCVCSALISICKAGPKISGTDVYTSSDPHMSSGRHMLRGPTARHQSISVVVW